MDIETFDERLRVAMAARGVRGRELAGRLGATEALVSRWLNQRSTPSLVYLEKMPSALEVSGHWLLTGEGSMAVTGEAGRKLELLEWALGSAGLSRLLDLAEAAQIAALEQYLPPEAGREDRD